MKECPNQYYNLMTLLFPLLIIRPSHFLLYSVLPFCRSPLRLSLSFYWFLLYLSAWSFLSPLNSGWQQDADSVAGFWCSPLPMLFTCFSTSAGIYPACTEWLRSLCYPSVGWCVPTLSVCRLVNPGRRSESAMPEWHYVIALRHFRASIFSCFFVHRMHGCEWPGVKFKIS